MKEDITPKGVDFYMLTHLKSYTLYENYTQKGHGSCYYTLVHSNVWRFPHFF